MTDTRTADADTLVEPDDDGSGFSVEQTALLERAAGYEYHEGPMIVEEENAGDFWAIECRDVYKRFGRNQILNGLNVGIPEGMITVVLGPSGTGKSVLIKHLIGLLFPDQGDVLVHGQRVKKMTMPELLAMRRKFGILFQDGALFGSMNVFDNVAFPLRQHTDLGETAACYARLRHHHDALHDRRHAGVLVFVVELVGDRGRDLRPAPRVEPHVRLLVVQRLLLRRDQLAQKYAAMSAASSLVVAPPKQ